MLTSKSSISWLPLLFAIPAFAVGIASALSGLELYSIALSRFTVGSGVITILTPYGASVAYYFVGFLEVAAALFLSCACFIFYGYMGRSRSRMVIKARNFGMTMTCCAIAAVFLASGLIIPVANATISSSSSAITSQYSCEKGPGFLIAVDNAADYYAIAASGTTTTTCGTLVYGGPNNVGGATGTSFATVMNDAITAMSPGGAITIEAGSYVVAATITAGVQNTTLNFSPAAFLAISSSVSPGISVTASFVTITGGVFSGGENPGMIDDQAASGALKGNIVENAVFDKFTGGSSCSSGTEAAVQFRNTSYGKFIGNTVNANDVLGSYGVVLLTDLANYNLVSQNYFSKTACDSIFVEQSGGGTMPIGNTITQNNIYDSSDGAVESQGKDTIISLNTVWATSGFTSDGYLSCSTAALQCSIIDNTENDTAGITLFSNGAAFGANGSIIEGNILYRTVYGIFCANICYNTQILNNQMLAQQTAGSSTSSAIGLDGGTNLIVSGNYIFDPYQIGIVLHAVTGGYSNIVVSNNQVVSPNLQASNKGFAGMLFSTAVSESITNMTVSNNYVAARSGGSTGSGMLFKNSNSGVQHYINTVVSNNQVYGHFSEGAINASATKAATIEDVEHMVFTNNAGYNPLGTIATSFDTTRDFVTDSTSGGSATPANATAMINGGSPKLICMYAGSSWTSTHRLVIQIAGTQVVSTTAPVASVSYCFTVSPGQTYYAQYQSSQATFVVIGE
jgi:Right handed beta helix region